MSIVCWNCRGLGNLRVIPKIKFLIRYYKPGILFLSETILHVNKIEEFPICWIMILVLHRIELVEEDVLLCFGEIQLIVALSVILLIILVLKLKKKVVGLGCSQVFMDI